MQSCRAMLFKQIRNTETGLTGETFFNFNCRTQRFKNSSIVYVNYWVYKRNFCMVIKSKVLGVE